MEAAAIFIQKNYRGYRTRNLLREYFYQICQDEMDYPDGAEMQGG